MAKFKWHKIVVFDESCETIEAIENDDEVQWQTEPGYVLITMVALLPAKDFAQMLQRYGVSEALFDGACRESEDKICIDVCKARIKKIWDDNPLLYREVLTYVPATQAWMQVGFFSPQGLLQKKIVGQGARDVCKAMARAELNISTAHAMYVGRELQRLESCLQAGVVYTQD